MTTNRLNELTAAFLDELDQQGLVLNPDIADQVIAGILDDATVTAQCSMNQALKIVTPSVMRARARSIGEYFISKELDEMATYAGVTFDRPNACRLIVLLAAGSNHAYGVGDLGGLRAAGDIMLNIGLALMTTDSVELTGAGAYRALAALESFGGADTSEVPVLCASFARELAQTIDRSRDGEVQELTVPMVPML